MGDPGDQAAGRVSPTSNTSTKDHRGEAEAVPLASVGCVMERSYDWPDEEDCLTLDGVGVGLPFLSDHVIGRQQEADQIPHGTV